MNETISLQSVGPRHPLEDAFAVDSNGTAFAVADGVSRVEYGTDAHHFSGILRALAQDFCDLHLKRSIEVQPELALAGLGVEANVRAHDANQLQSLSSDLDSSVLDPFAIVGAAGIIQGDRLFFGHIGDCGIGLADRMGVLRVLTPDQLNGLRGHMAKMNFPDRLARWMYVRERLRNRPQAQDRCGNRIGYGVINGEPEALSFWRCSSVPIKYGDVVVVYSDGALPFLRSPASKRLLGSISGGGSLNLPEWDRVWREQQPSDDDATLVILVVSSPREPLC